MGRVGRAEEAGEKLREYPDRRGDMMSFGWDVLGPGTAKNTAWGSKVMS